MGPYHDVSKDFCKCGIAIPACHPCGRCLWRLHAIFLSCTPLQGKGTVTYQEVHVGSLVCIKGLFQHIKYTSFTHLLSHLIRVNPLLSSHCRSLFSWLEVFLRLTSQPPSAAFISSPRATVDVSAFVTTISHWHLSAIPFTLPSSQPYSCASHFLFLLCWASSPHSTSCESCIYVASDLPLFALEGSAPLPGSSPAHWPCMLAHPSAPLLQENSFLHLAPQSPPPLAKYLVALEWPATRLKQVGMGTKPTVFFPWALMVYGHWQLWLEHQLKFFMILQVSVQHCYQWCTRLWHPFHWPETFTSPASCSYKFIQACISPFFSSKWCLLWYSKH